MEEGKGWGNEAEGGGRKGNAGNAGRRRGGEQAVKEGIEADEGRGRSHTQTDGRKIQTIRKNDPSTRPMYEQEEQNEGTKQSCVLPRGESSDSQRIWRRSHAMAIDEQQRQWGRRSPSRTRNNAGFIPSPARTCVIHEAGYEARRGEMVA